MIVPDTAPALSGRPSRISAWLERAQGAVLGIVSLYFLAIGQLSPHPLPGLRWLAFAVLGAAFASVFRSTRFRRVASAMCFVAVACGLVGVGDIAAQSRPAAHAHR